MDRIEQALGTTPVNTAVKCAEEQAFASLNGSNLMSVEDAAKRILERLRDDYQDVNVHARHSESLHTHDSSTWTCIRPRSNRMSSRAQQPLIPGTLLTSFLGSGKTTLLSHLVQQTALSDAPIIIKEFGGMVLDRLFVAHSTESLVMKMSSGCLCYYIRGDPMKIRSDITWRFSRCR